MELSGRESERLTNALEALASENPSGTRLKATVSRVEGGVVYARIGDGDEFPLQDMTFSADVNDELYVAFDGISAHATGNITDPAVGGEYTRSKIVNPELSTIREAAVKAGKIADEADKVAKAVNQHFWDDDNGAHVTDVTREEWAQAVSDSFSDMSATKQYSNLLMNALGILLRSALTNLVSITRSAVAFFDGAGNAASNIVARFGADGASIGKADESHMELDYHSMQLVDQEDNIFFYAGDLRDRSGKAQISEGFVFTRNMYDDSGMVQVAFPPAVEIVDILYSDGDSILGTSAYAEIVSGGYLISIETTEDLSGENGTLVYKTSGAAYSYTLGTRGNGAVAPFSVVAGESCVASGNGSHAEGASTTASGRSSHAEGADTTASGISSHAGGVGTTAGYHAQTAIGTFNDNKSSNLFEVGNGQQNARSNAFEVDKNGNVVAAGSFSGGVAGNFLQTSFVIVNAETVAAGGYLSGTHNLSSPQNGYTPIGIVGQTSDMRYVSFIRAYISDASTNTGTLHWMVYNSTTSAKTPTMRVYVLWAKS